MAFPLSAVLVKDTALQEKPQPKATLMRHYPKGVEAKERVH